MGVSEDRWSSPMKSASRGTSKNLEEDSPDDIIEAPKNERTRKFFSSILRH